MARCGCANGGPAVLRAADDSVQVKGGGSIFDPYYITVPSKSKPGNNPGSSDIVTVKGWALAGAWTISSVTKTDGVVVAANIIWPDGTTGTWVADSVNDTFDAVDGWHATYGSTLITQPAVTRDSAGIVTHMPTLVVSI